MITFIDVQFKLMILNDKVKLLRIILNNFNIVFVKTTYKEKLMLILTLY